MEFNNALSGKTLAPVNDYDRRDQLPKVLFIVNQKKFMTKLLITFSILGICYFTYINFNSYILRGMSIFVLGLMYAHMVELQHECLHEGAFKNRKLNRYFGNILGLFMFSSYSHYKHDHLLHHSYLGTEDNIEFFNYRFRNLNSLRGFGLGLFYLGRYIDLFKNIVRSLIGGEIPGVRSKNWERKIRHEYIFMFSIFVLTFTYSIYLNNFDIFFLWYLPSLLISEPVHFLIELPEHYGLNTISQPNVLKNTRTIKTNKLWQWFTNYNNLHTAHHYHHGVPMCNVPILHNIIKEKISVNEESYFKFYLNVINGTYTYKSEENCMTR